MATIPAPTQHHVNKRFIIAAGAALALAAAIGTWQVVEHRDGADTEGSASRQQVVSAAVQPAAPAAVSDQEMHQRVREPAASATRAAPDDRSETRQQVDEARMLPAGHGYLPDVAVVAPWNPDIPLAVTRGSVALTAYIVSSQEEALLQQRVIEEGNAIRARLGEALLSDTLVLAAGSAEEAAGVHRALDELDNVRQYMGLPAVDRIDLRPSGGSGAPACGTVVVGTTDTYPIECQ